MLHFACSWPPSKNIKDFLKSLLPGRVGEKSGAPGFCKPERRKLDCNLVEGRMSTDSVFQFSVQNNTLTAWKLTAAWSFEEVVKGNRSLKRTPPSTRLFFFFFQLNSSTSVTFVEAQKFIFKRRLNKSLRTGRHYLHLKMKVLGPALWLTW